MGTNPNTTVKINETHLLVDQLVHNGKYEKQEFLHDFIKNNLLWFTLVPKVTLLVDRQYLPTCQVKKNVDQTRKSHSVISQTSFKHE